MILFTISLLALIPILIYWYFSWNFNYWTKRGVKGPTPKIIVGNFPSVFKGDRNIAYDFDDIYKKYKNKEKYVGVFMGREPQLLVLSPDLAHDIFVTKFKNFYDNYAGHMLNENHEPAFALNPFFLKGQQWKNKRAEITPALTMNRVKASYPVMEMVGNKLVDFIKDKINSNGKTYDFDAKDLCSRYTVQTVSDCVYGIDAGSLNKDKDSEMLLNAKKMLTDFMAAFEKLTLLNTVPLLSKLFKVEFLKKDVKYFYTKLMYDAIDLRKKSENDRVDFLNYIIHLKEKNGMTEIEMLAHFLSFFADGFETSATTMSSILLWLGRNQKAQERLRQEVEKNIDSTGKVPFDKLHELPYLNACFYETMRVFPVISFTSKVCTEETTIENFDGSSLTVKKGMVVNIPGFCFCKDEEYFEDPETFDPERFVESGSEKKYRDRGVFTPFGDGPRICLGQKFGVTQVKYGICEIVRNFEISVSEKSRKDNIIGNESIITSLKGGVYINLKEIKN